MFLIGRCAFRCLGILKHNWLDLWQVYYNFRNHLGGLPLFWWLILFRRLKSWLISLLLWIGSVLTVLRRPLHPPFYLTLSPTDIPHFILHSPQASNFILHGHPPPYPLKTSLNFILQRYLSINPEETSPTLSYTNQWDGATMGHNLFTFCSLLYTLYRGTGSVE